MKFSNVAVITAGLLALYSPTNIHAFTPSLHKTQHQSVAFKQHHRQNANPATMFSSTLPDVDKETTINGSTEVTPRDLADTPSTPKYEVKDSTNNEEKSNDMRQSINDSITSSGVAAAAAMATAAVNAAVAMKTLDAPDVAKSYIALDTSSTEVDKDGLPLVYDKDAIEKFWKKERGALNQRWSYFVGKAVPFLTKLITLFISEGKIDDRHIPGLSRQARLDLQDLGPTFIKAGQMMSVRPDVLPQSTLEELTKLQDAVVPFPTTVAVSQIEAELKAPLGQYFSSISEEPVAAASLAQVYLATLNDEAQTRVAIKVQRPDVLNTVSKDLYVLRRAAEVFQGLVERFAPQQKTNYVALLNEWAIGFYTELDFQSEARNQMTLRQDLIDNGIKGVTVPKVFEELCTRRILVSEWMDGIKLSECSTDEIKDITAIAQEAFLTQLFETGFFHADPHPGNILKLNEPTEEGHTVALIDCGLMASIDSLDRDNMISAVIHLANKDYASLVDDFMELNILPRDSDRATIIPLMDKALSPYVKGGGAKKYEEELKRLYGMEDNNLNSQVGGFQAMTQDALTVLQDVPFSIPPYFAILGRAIVTLEGVALTGNPNYGIIMESYPFIARKLLREDRPEIQRALQEVLFSSQNSEGGAFKFTRLIALLNNAAGESAVGGADGGAFVDLDAIPEDGGISFADSLKYLLSDKAESLRTLLEGEVDTLVDVLLRQIVRRGASEAIVALALPRPPSLPFFDDLLSRFVPSPPKVEEIPLPLLLPSLTSSGSITTDTPSVGILTINDFVDLVAPKLNRDEELYALSLSDAADEFLGEDLGQLVRGEGIISTKTAQLLLNTVTRTTRNSGGENDDDALQQVTKVVSSLLATLSQGNTANRDGGFDELLGSALDGLSQEERTRLDDISSELINHSVQRARERLAGVQRLI